MAADPGSEILQRILDEAIKPNAEAIASIWEKGDVAILFFEVADEHAGAARSGGWTGKSVEVHRMKRKRAMAFAESLPANDPAVSWLRRRGPGRIFVFVHRGTLCINHVPGKGYSIESGTLDRQWMA